MRRTVAVALTAAALIATGCGPDTQDVQELRRYINRSELSQREFTYEFASARHVYTVTGAIQDDFRYRMTLASQGRELMQHVVSDDALAVRIAAPEILAALPPSSLGHPDVEAALREGRWVLDPSGAPPMIRPQEDFAGFEVAVDPFREALGAFQFVSRSIGESFAVREFNFESIDYKPSQDPWRYPREADTEIRYDLARPWLPKTEDQIGGQQGDITEGEFRKLSAYVHDGRIREICSFVDIYGHEDYIKLREKGEGGNPFHRNLFKRIREGRTARPIVEKEIHVAVRYPEQVVIDLPADDPHIGKLESFSAAFTQALKDGVLQPPSGKRPNIEACDRPPGADEPPRG